LQIVEDETPLAICETTLSPSTLSTSKTMYVSGITYRCWSRHSQIRGKSGFPSASSATSSPSRTARTGTSATNPTYGVMSQPRRLRTRSGPSVDTIARNPSYFTS
jgi:hypothetical protein